MSIGAIPTKVNLNNGTGVPGGYSAASVQPPTGVTKAMNSNIAAISAKKAELANSTLDPVKKLEATKKLDAMQKKSQSKLNAAKMAPDFTKKYKMPAAPAIPSTPDFKNAGIPEIPSVPITSTPSIPKIPSIGGI
jgi:hypothetical protein